MARGGDKAGGKAVFLHQEGGVHTEANQQSLSLISCSETSRRCSKYLQTSSTVWEPNSFPGDISGKEPAASAGDIREAAPIPGLGRSPGGGHGHPLQYSFLESPTDRGAWGLQSMGSQRVRHD